MTTKEINEAISRTTRIDCREKNSELAVNLRSWYSG